MKLHKQQRHENGSGETRVLVPFSKEDDVLIFSLSLIDAFFPHTVAMPFHTEEKEAPS